MIFSAYSNYYNLLYRDKDYQAEADYIEELVKKYSSIQSKVILDVGCGTGSHLEIFSRKGYTVYGVDISKEMIDIAVSRFAEKLNGNFKCCSAADFNFGNKFELIISLFHVASYQNTNEKLYCFFKNIFENLEKGGIFIYDFWYGPAVINDPPVTRIKRLEDQDIKVTRIAEPERDVNNNTVDVNYELIIQDKKTGVVTFINETHTMRYLFIPELEYMLGGIGFTIVRGLEWMATDGSLSENNWNGLIIARKA